MTAIVEDNPTTNTVQPATATWIGTSGDWYDAANWSTGNVPTSNDIVTIENTTKGTTYEISFSNGNPSYAGLNLLASNGGGLKLSGLTSYQGSSQSDITIKATGSGSFIDLSDVTTLRGGRSLNVLSIEAQQGGDIDLSGVTRINGGTTEVLSESAGSTIDLSNLTEFIDDDFDRSLLKTRNGGFINLENVTKLEEVDLSTDNSVLYLENLTTYEGDNNVDATNGGQISLVNLENVVGQILQVTATGTRSRIVISQELDVNEYIGQEDSGGDVIISNSDSALNFPPIVNTAIPGQRATEDQAFTFVIPSDTFVDFDPSDRLTYTATLANNSPLPSWLAFNANTRTFSGTPTNDQVGRLSINIRATDGEGSSTSTRFILDVVNVNDPPVVANPIADQNTTAGQNFALTLAGDTFTDTDLGDVLTYTATLEGGASLPSWLSFEPGTRSFRGIPTNADAGTLNLSVIATDRTGATATDTFALSIAGTTGNTPPIVENAILDQTATEDQLFTFQFPEDTFNDIDPGDTLTYSASLENGNPLPAWLSFDSATRTLSGTPGNTDVGPIIIAVSATDTSNAVVVDSFVLTVVDVANNPPIVSTLIPDQTTTEDQPFTFQIPANTFTDPDPGDTLTYSVVELPLWLSFDAATGTFSGTPGNGDIGAVSLTVIATDPEGASVSDTFALTIENVNDPPFVLNPIPEQGAIIDRPFTTIVPSTTFDDPDGELLDLIYSATNVPEWLTFDPDTLTFTGTPSVDDYGTVIIDVTATDPAGASVSTPLNIFVGIDALQYGASYSDLIQTYGLDLVALSDHYDQFGRAEGRSPDQFDEDRYVASNLDLIPFIADSSRLVNDDLAAQHYISNGFIEGRSLTSFQPDQYLASYTDLINLFGYDLTAGSVHYVQYGSVEGRPVDTFDEYRYLAGYDDLLNTFGTDGSAATQHYIVIGSQPPDNRDPLAFASDIYIASYGDLIQAVQPISDYATKLLTAGQHYVFYGRGEGRVKEVFNPTSYLANNPDVAAEPLFNSPSGAAQHYIEFGYFEGRIV